MTTIDKISLECPVCKNTFPTEVTTSYNQFGQATDLRPNTMGNSLILYLMHSCTKCGYTGRESDFENQDIPKRVKELIRDRITPLVQDGYPTAAKRFEMAVWIAEGQGKPSLDIGYLYLHAAWCFQDDPPSKPCPSEEHYRRQAIDYFERALEEEGLPHPTQLNLTYLIGELFRRIGEKEKASVWFERVVKLAGIDPEFKVFSDLAVRQNTAPEENI